MARRKDHTREELEKLILSAAGKIVAKDGATALTARKLATAIGYVPGTIYNVFGSMDGVILRLNAHTLDQLLAVLQHPDLAAPARPLDANLLAMADAYHSFIRKQRPFWLMLFTTKLPSERKNLDWYRSKIEELFIPLEVLLQNSDLNIKPVTARLAARTLWASVHGIYMLEETGRIPVVAGQSPVKDMIKLLIEGTIAGLATTK